MSTIYILVICSGVLALLYGAFTIRSVLSLSTGNEKMVQIASAIQEGARAYLNRQYQVITLVGLVILAILTWLLGWHVAVGFLIGSVLSGLAGYIGMNVSVRANVRTAEAARQGLQPALDVSFKAGAVTGMLVVGLGIIGITGYYFYLLRTEVPIRNITESLVALGFGASLISIFARLSREG